MGAGARSPVDLEVAVAQPLGQGDRVRGGRHGHRRVQHDSMRSLVGFGGVGASRQIEVTRRAGNIRPRTECRDKGFSGRSPRRSRVRYGRGSPRSYAKRRSCRLSVEVLRVRGSKGQITINRSGVVVQSAVSHFGEGVRPGNRLEDEGEKETGANVKECNRPKPNPFSLELREKSRTPPSR